MRDPAPFPSPRLRPNAIVTVPASSAPFDVRKWFESHPGVRFSTVWHEFKRRFYGVTEKAYADVTFCKYDLLSPSPDGPIITELGGEERSLSALGAVSVLIRNQGRGQAGILQTSGYANIFYSRDADGILCAVRLGWVEEGWVIDALAVADPLAWNGSHAIFWPSAPGPAEGGFRPGHLTP